MKANTLPDLNYLKECFELDPSSPSYLKWNPNRPRGHFKSEKSYQIWKKNCAVTTQQHFGWDSAGLTVEMKPGLLVSGRPSLP